MPSVGMPATRPKTITKTSVVSTGWSDEPERAEQRLLVARNEVAPDEQHEQVAVFPELAPVEAAASPRDGSMTISCERGAAVSSAMPAGEFEVAALHRERGGVALGGRERAQRPAVGVDDAWCRARGRRRSALSCASVLVQTS